jgi:hypothetical protein
VVGMKQILREEMDLYQARYLRVNSGSINWDDLSRVRHQTALAKVPLIFVYRKRMHHLSRAARPHGWPCEQWP